MANTSNNTIRIDVSPGAKILDYKGSGIIRPGAMLILNPANEVTCASVSDVRISPLFAIENIWQGKGIDDYYADDDTVYLVHCIKGDIVWAWLDVVKTIGFAEAVSISVGSDGYFKFAEAGDFRMGISLDDVTTTAEPKRFRLAIM